ncbi:hypothetical protein ACOSP7_012547 [Xanthoceras sorbifolium]
MPTWPPMKRVIFVWFFFFNICCKAASCSSTTESTFTSKAAGSYKQLGIKQTQYKNGYGSKLMMKPNKESDHHHHPMKRPTTSRTYKRLQEAVDHIGNHVVQKLAGDHELVSDQLKKANKGIYGGGDLVRPKRKKGAASSVVKRSSSLLLSIAFRVVTIGLLVFLFF